MNTFRTEMREAAYKSMCKVNPGVINALVAAIKNGETARKIEKRFVKKYGNGNLTSNSTILAAYHIEAHPELLDVQL